MELSNVMKTLLSSDSVKNLSKATGTTQKDVKSVLNSALPLLLEGAGKQAADKKTSAGFAGALTKHAKADTGDLARFLDGVDLADGARIIGHLLGGKTDDTAKKVAGESGVSSANVTKILSAAAPLLMSLLGQNAGSDKDDKVDLGDLAGALLNNVDVGSLLTGLLSGDDKAGKAKKKSAKKDDGIDLGDVADLLGGLLK